MRRLLAVIHGPVFGGGFNQTMRLAAPLRERGWESLAMVPDLPEAGATLERVRAGGLPAGTLELHRLRRSTDLRAHWTLARTFPREVARLRGLIRRLDVELVQAFGDTNPHLAIAAHLEDVAVVWHLYDTVTPVPARRVTMPLVTRLADVVLTTGRALAHEYPGAAALGDRCITVYPPVDVTEFRPDPALRAAARAELGVGEGELVVGTVGNRNPTKGHDHLVRAFAAVAAEHPRAVLRILGQESPVHAEHMAAVDGLVEQLGVSERTRILDPGRRVAQLLPAFDVFVLASVPRSEGMPTVILEAMACGVPVIATDVGAVAEVVEEGATGHVVPPLDDAALAARIGELLAAGSARARMGARGRELAEQRYGLDACADRYAAAFERALAFRVARRQSA